jgi:phosphate transport system permease protein
MTTPLHTDPARSTIDDLEAQLEPPALPRHAIKLVGGAAVVVGGVLVALGMSIALAIVLAWLAFIIVAISATVAVEGSRKGKDRAATLLISSAFGIALLPLVSLLWIVVKNGAPAISGQFLTYSMRNVVGPGGGIYHAILGTLIVTALAAVMSIPIGILSAIYLVEYGSGKLAKSITFLVDVMTGIPSIVAGLFAYALFVIFFGEGIRMGFGGSIALSVLMIPLVVRSCEEMLKLVPNELREASYALGVPKWRTIIKVVIPTALAGIVTGITIAVARIIGETAPLLIICGATDSVNLNPFSERMMTLPVFIFNSYKSPGVPPEYGVERAWGAALVLTVIIMLLNLIARLVSYYFSPKKA